jgi:histidine triad (HIT) family protein
MDCIFCKIAKGEIPSKKVYEDTHIYAFLDINPCTTGHVLIIPKKHAQLLEEMNEKEIADLFIVATKLEKRAKNNLGAIAANIGINDGKAAGSEVPHVHVHMIPRYSDDGGGAMQSIVRMHIDRSKFDEVASKMSGSNDHESGHENKKTSYDDFFR